MKKIVYLVFLGLGLVGMLFYSTIAILKAYTDLSMSAWIFNSAQLRLIIFTAYTVAMIMLRSVIFYKR